MVQHLECRVDGFIELPRDKTFKLLIDTPGKWWVSPFAGVDAGNMEVTIEPFPGGCCYETDPSGQRRIWGTVLSIEDPLYVRLAWQVSEDGQQIADPSAASRVMINFRAVGEGTLIEIVHSEFLRHGEDGAAYLEKMSGPMGWRHLVSQIMVAAGSGRG